MNLSYLFEKIDKIREKDKARFSQSKMLLYVVEEMGEIAECLCNSEGLKDKNLKETTRDECIDTLLALLALYRNVGGDEEHFHVQMKKKMNKWEKRTERLSN